MAESTGLVFNPHFTPEELAQWLGQTLRDIDFQPLKDANITGGEVFLLDSSLFKELGYTLKESVRIVGLVKSLVKCFEVRAKYVGAEKKKGIRGTIYRCAEEHKACYSLEHSKSIYYDGSSNDLNIALLFRERSEADSFVVFLTHWYLNNSLIVQPGDVTVEDEKVTYVAESDLKKVRLSDYDATDSESPIQTLEELAVVPSSESNVSALSMNSPLAQLQMIERPEVFTCSRPIKCHIKPKKDFKKLINDENNILAMSRSFYDYFDGMMTVDCETGNIDIPLIAIKPPGKREFREEMVGNLQLKRKRVEVVVECRGEAVGEIVGKQLKMGTERLSATQYKTPLHVENPVIVLIGSTRISGKKSITDTIL